MGGCRGTATKGEGKGSIGCADDGHGGRSRRSKWESDHVGIERADPFMLSVDTYVETDCKW